MSWVPVIFGWPGALTSILLSAVGLVLKRPALVLAGAVVGLPFMFYVSGLPGTELLGILASASHFGAAAAMWRRRRLAASLLFVPTPTVTSYIAWLLMFGPARWTPG